MIDKMLRSPKEHVLTPTVRSLRFVHPNVVTLIALAVGLLAAVAAWQQLYLVALGLWLFNRVLDGLDGTIARIHNKQSDFGGYLDIVLDMVVYAAIPIGIVLGTNTTADYISLIILLGSFYVNAASWMYLAALLEKRKLGAQAQGEMTTVTMPAGLVEGTETIIFYSLFLLFPGALVYLFLAMAIMVLITSMQRLIWAARNL